MRALKILVAAGVVAVAGLGTSAPAMAAVNPSVVSVTCTDIGNFCSSSKFSAPSITANPGSAFTVHNGTRFAGEFAIGTSIFPDQTLAVGSGLSWAGSGGASIPLIVTNDFIDPPPPPIPVIGLQQVGVPASGDCADVPVTVGHDQGYPIGGWSKSWAYWIYNGTGGPVCTRTVEEIPNGDGTNRLVLDTNP